MTVPRIMRFSVQEASQPRNKGSRCTRLDTRHANGARALYVDSFRVPCERRCCGMMPGAYPVFDITFHGRQEHSTPRCVAQRGMLRPVKREKVGPARILPNGLGMGSEITNLVRSFAELRCWNQHRPSIVIRKPRVHSIGCVCGLEQGVLHLCSSQVSPPRMVHACLAV